MAMRGAPPLSRQLPNGRLALLSLTYMRRYLERRLPLWYPGYRLRTLRIKDRSALHFKKSIEYTLVMDAPGTRLDIRQVLRANVPSLDTTEEARIADVAMRAIWRRYDLSGGLRICRPLGFDERLRALFYEDVPGRPLTSLVRRGNPTLAQYTRLAGRWLAELHRERIRVGRARPLARERLEAHYFLLNIERYHPTSLARARRILDAYFVRRAKLASRIRASACLIHGDYNFGNIIVDENTETIGVIDFGNAWRYDPMSDLANAVVQNAVLAWQHRVRPSVRDRVATLFLEAYRRKAHLSAHDQARFRLFLAWWSMQTLSYTLALSFVVDKSPMIHDSLKRAERALTL